MGPAPLLSDAADAMLVNWVKALAVKGSPVTKCDLLSSIENTAKDSNKRNVFPNGKPGYKWLQLLLRRDLQIAEQTVEKLSKVWANDWEQLIRDWFKENSLYLKVNNLLEVVKDQAMCSTWKSLHFSYVKKETRF